MSTCSCFQLRMMVIVAKVSFWVTMVALGSLNLTLLATVLVPSVQGWPPPGRDTWQYRGTWMLFALGSVGLLVVGGLDAGSLGLRAWIGEAGTVIVGSALVIAGTAIASYAMGYLGLRGCLGLEATLVTEGPFALSRNPGYVGDLTLIVGYVVLTDSRLAGLAGAALAVWFVLAPFAEEPWLEGQYGEAYRRYRAQTPRWLSVSSQRCQAA